MRLAVLAALVMGCAPAYASPCPAEQLPGQCLAVYVLWDAYGWPPRDPPAVEFVEPGTLGAHGSFHSGAYRATVELRPGARLCQTALPHELGHAASLVILGHADSAHRGPVFDLERAATQALCRVEDVR